MRRFHCLRSGWLNIRQVYDSIGKETPTIHFDMVANLAYQRKTGLTDSAKVGSLHIESSCSSRSHQHLVHLQESVDGSHEILLQFG
jgi:hypothetical protein